MSDALPERDNTPTAPETPADPLDLPSDPAADAVEPAPTGHDTAAPAVDAPDEESPAGPDLAASIVALSAAVDRLNERARNDQEIISRMQSRIEALQGDQVSALLGPIVTELANLHAEFATAATRDFERLGLDRVRKEFDILGDRVTSALDLLGAESLEAEVGEVFDSRIHSAVRQVPTTDPALDKTIAAIVRQGFSFDTTAKPALYARVAVYAFDGAAAPEIALTENAALPEEAPVVIAPVVEDDEIRLPFESDK